MGILSKIKSLLPASSRSLHAMYREVGQMHGHLGEMWGEVGQTRYMAIDALERLETIEDRVRAMDGRMMVMLWELYRRNGEALPEAKRRMMGNLSPATGETRLYQLAGAQLLFEFDELCRAHDLTYWLFSGTLIGAVRHAGFIPWDDDLDVGMVRQDIERLIELVKDDGRYAVTVRYDYYVHCRQVRFRYADRQVPCFIDLFYFDPVARMSKDAFCVREGERVLLERALEDDEVISAYWNEANQFVDEGTDDAVRIREHFDRHVKALYDRGTLTASLDDAEALVWGIDNVNSGVAHHSWYQIPKDRLLPTARMPFEGHQVFVPADSDWCLAQVFGDIYDMPDKVGSYFDHFTGSLLKDPDVRAALEGVVAGADAGAQER